ncbi:HAD family hydrolase [Candidatus Woesearchaeota archaeon]|nr:HAD family hydrolase [Candidatus Woesearchaeota archaeon]
MIKAVGFDFDGTLIMSEERKAQAMARVLAEQFGIRKGVERAYRQVRGLNRNRKVAKLLQKFLKRAPTKMEIKNAEKSFAKYYQTFLQACPLFQCTNVIQELKKQVDFLFLLSLENEEEVVKVAKHCGLVKFFDEILGGPPTKVENLKHIIKKHHLLPREMLYIADASSDIAATKKVGVKIVLIGRKFNYHDLLQELQADFVFSSLCEVPYLEKLQ